MANVVSASSPAAASHATGPVVGRNPTSTATTTTIATASTAWMTLPRTWPASTDGPRDRHRPEPGDDPLGHVHRHRDRRALRRAGDGDQQDPGHDVGDVARARPPAGAPPSPAPSVPPRTYTNSSRKTTGIPAMKNVSDG